MKYKADQYGAAALRKMASSLLETTENITKDANSVFIEAQGRQNGLGAHYKSILKVLDDTMKDCQSASGKVAEISNRLLKIADIYEEVGSNNPYEKVKKL